MNDDWLNNILDDTAPTDPENVMPDGPGSGPEGPGPNPTTRPAEVIYFPKPGPDAETTEINADDFDVAPLGDNDPSPTTDVETVNFDDFDVTRSGANDPRDTPAEVTTLDTALPLDTPAPAVDAATVDLRAQLADDLGRLADELTAITAAERDESVRAVLDTATRQLGVVREAAADVRAQDAERVTQIVGDLSDLVDALTRR